ncbi:MAG TPA: hypothetical protein VFN02_14665 [Ktedonobacteraceae bacterium]|nr:hypothetical protein [Ktedonobacteraceae bacterium]
MISPPNASIPTRMSARRTVAGPGAGITGALFALLTWNQDVELLDA